VVGGPATGIGLRVAGGGRTDRVSARDLEVLEFIARYGVVPRDAVGVWAGTAKTATQTRERRLALAGLIEVSRPWGTVGVFVNATRAGLRACLRDELTVARPAPSTLHHDAVCARLGARLEREGKQLLSERELRAEERGWGKRVHSIRLRARLHRPDLMRVGDQIIPIEAELTRKSQGRLEEIVRLWRNAVLEERFQGVHYYCAPAVLPYVGRAIERADADAQIRIDLLPEDDLLATSLLA
jgi:hypothetical protein